MLQCTCDSAAAIHGIGGLTQGGIDVARIGQEQSIPGQEGIAADRRETMRNGEFGKANAIHRKERAIHHDHGVGLPRRGFGNGRSDVFRVAGKYVVQHQAHDIRAVV